MDKLKNTGGFTLLNRYGSTERTKLITQKVLEKKSFKQRWKKAVN